MKKGAIATLLVVAILAGAGAGYLTGNSNQRTTTSVSTTTVTATFVQTTSAHCIETGVHGFLYVRVVSDNTSIPISGANVTVTILDYCGSEYTIPLGHTNGTGYTPSPVDWTGALLVDVRNAGVGHIFLTETSGAVSLATVNLPSGLTVIKPIACYGLPATCSNTTTTTTAAAYPVASG
ncbi:MAG: hypothetical protein JRM96_03095 [Nitrososphaerota archaeon]|jgi:hypothetical protein|nr:hypothetical protein [Ferrimicrobium acidiphilum]MCL4355343.1 hypothetical protein [Nitrososphaerota archaeon]MDG6912928.1 hypothetical protein [Nitrososphaerota archaeon]MDG6952415.1 hypothetical protein [Nitrososphaerota archaeon]MDG6980920.1 hypothetical protein [Nitrososphaerota archaeon]